MKRLLLYAFSLALTSAAVVMVSNAQPPDFSGFGPGMRGPGGPGGPHREERKLLGQFDLDKNGWLDNRERIPAQGDSIGASGRWRQAGFSRTRASRRSGFWGSGFWGSGGSWSIATDGQAGASG